jgi:protein ImuA
LSALAALWRADRLADSVPAVWPTGHAALDAELPGGGWPAAGLTELLLAQPGTGEWRLLAPALAGRDGDVVCIAPPALPYAPALQTLGLAPARLVCVRAAAVDAAAWAAEQALRAGCCAAVLWWGDLALPALRRLHLAAGASPLFALRPAAAQAQASPAPLRVACTPAPHGRVAVRILKRRGPPMERALTLTLPTPAGLRWHPVAAPAAESPDGLARRLPARVAA